MFTFEEDCVVCAVHSIDFFANSGRLVNKCTFVNKNYKICAGYIDYIDHLKSSTFVKYLCVSIQVIFETRESILLAAYILFLSSFCLK